MGDAAEALAQLQLAQKGLERAFGPYHPSVADVLQDQASLQARLGQHALAVASMTRSLALRERLEQPPSLQRAGALQTLGASFAQLGQDDLALDAQARSLAMARAVGAPEVELSMILLSTGVVKSRQGRHGEALALYEQARGMLARQPDGGGVRMATLLNNIATAQVRQGAYADAQAPLQGALALWEAAKGPGSLEVATALNNLAELHVSLGEPRLARPLHERSLAIRQRLLPPGNGDLLSSRNNLAFTLLMVGEPDAAAAQLRSALAAAEREPATLMTGVLYNTLARLEADAGRRDKALPLQQRALEIARQRAQPIELELSLRNLAALQLATGEPSPGTFDLLREALDAAAPEQLQDGGAQTRHWLSVAHARAGRMEQAIFWGKLAVNAVQQQRRKLQALEAGQRDGFLALMPDIHGHLAGLLLGRNRVAEAQQILQMLKEHEQSELVMRAGAADPRVTELPLDAREQALFQEFQALQAQLNAVWKEPPRPQDLARLREASARFLSALDRGLADDRAHLWALSPGAVQQRLRATLELLARDDPGSQPAALQYVLMGTDLYIVLSSAGAPPLVRRVPAGPALTKSVAQARLMLASPDADLAGLQARLKGLHDVLVAPVRQELARRNVRTLMVSANGDLRYLPWAALYDGQRYLVQDFAIAGFHEGVDNPFARPPRGPWQLAGLGVSQAVQGLPALAQVRAELDGLLKVPGMRGQVWLNGDFTRERLRRLLGDDYNVLHVASHFRFVHGSTDQSVLFLGDGTRLSLADIEREDLRFAGLDLLVLSACQTGVGGGYDQNGREIDGLGGLVQRRGARAVLMTLWPVSDDEMPMLMRAFYQQLAAGRSKAQALQAAQVGLLSRNLPGQAVPERARHPYFWAPVLMSGNWR